jgi:tetratricopeptide (TPR) repeat protein
MGTDSVSRLNNSAISVASLQDSRLSTVNLLLSNRNLDELITDRNRVLKAIDLAINARLNLDPFFDPKELSDVNRDFLADRILANIVCKEIIMTINPVYKIPIPKNFSQSRYAEYFDIEDYSIRFLLALVLSEKFSFLDSVYGGKLEIFQIDNGNTYRFKRRCFQKLQNSILLSESFPWLVYVDISNYYATIKKKNLIEIIKTKLSLSDENYFLKLLEKYFEKISIGSWCDNFIQNIYLSDLDLAMHSVDWNYMRMNDDIRVYCNSYHSSLRAFQTIENELKKLDLEINQAKQFVIEPMINRSTAKWRFYETRCYDYTRGEMSPIIELCKVTEYDIENIYMLTRDSDANECVQLKYNFRFQKRINFRDEVLNKLGFEIEGIDIREILENFESRERLSCTELKLLGDLIFYTSTSYQFTFRLVRLFVSRSVENIYGEGVVDVVQFVFKHLSSFSAHPNFANYSSVPTFLDYVFLRVVFLERSDYNNDLKHIRDVIIDWFERLIFRGKGGYIQYIQSVIRYIIDSRLFRFVDSHYSEKLADENFWVEIMHREFKRSGSLSRPRQKLNSVELIKYYFTNSYKINVSRANFSYVGGDFEQVVQSLRNCYIEDLSSEDLILLASSYFKLSDFKSAEEIYSNVLYLESHPTAYNNRGLIYLKANRIVEAIQDFSSAIKVRESSRYFENRATCYILTGQLVEALGDIDRAIEIDIQRSSKLEQLHLRIFGDFDFLPRFYAKYIEIFSLDRLSEFAYLKRAAINKSLGNISIALNDIETHCKERKLNDSTKTLLINKLMEDKLKW